MCSWAALTGWSILMALLEMDLENLVMKDNIIAQSHKIEK